MSSNMKYIRRHHHMSPKSGAVYCCSSYELKACLILDEDQNVAYYQSQLGFIVDERKRFLDFLVTYKNGLKKIIEVKPIRRIEQFKQQIEDNKKHARTNGYDFEIWTESNLGFTNDYDAKIWADQYLSEQHNIDYNERRKIMSQQRANRHYQNKIATDTVEVFCEFCQETHIPLRLTYEKNIERNGKYICEREGGKIAGSKPKKKKDNPYATEGKKQCNECKEIKLFEEFSPDKYKSDGYSTRCKFCRSNSYRLKYKSKDKNDPTT